jgi:hypothetical protein
MTNSRRILATAVLVLACAASDAWAQGQTGSVIPEHVFVNVNAGAQPAQRTIDKSETFSVYGETASVSSVVPIRNGALFDVSVGYRVWQKLAIAVGYSTFGRPSDTSVVAVVPSPIAFDQFKTTTADRTDLEHEEKAIHIQVVWFIPVSDKIDVSISAGPSFIRVSQDVISAVTIAPGTQDINTLTATTEEGTAKGGNVGLDINYLFTKNVGAGVFARYAGGSLDLPSAPGLQVGGFQVGAGVRLRF